MIIHNETVEYLKNFAEINQSLVIEKGNVIKTVSEQTNVMAKADLGQEFPQDFAIYDLNKFLGVLSLFAEPKFDFSEKSVKIQSSVDANNFTAGDSVAEYQFANMSLFENERKILAKDIELPSEDFFFFLSSKKGLLSVSYPCAANSNAPISGKLPENTYVPTCDNFIQGHRKVLISILCAN